MPGITNLHLVSDTGSSATDKITTNGTLTGSVATNGEPIFVEYDTDGDGMADGSVNPDMAGNFEFTPMAGMMGMPTTVRVRSAKLDMLTFANEYGGWSDEFTFTLNMPPTADTGSASVLRNASKVVTLDGFDMDSNDTLAVQLVGQPTHGSASLDGDTLTYTPSEDFTGTDTVRFVVKDSAGEASAAVDYTFSVVAVRIPRDRMGNHSIWLSTRMSICRSQYSSSAALRGCWFSTPRQFNPRRSSLSL